MVKITYEADTDILYMKLTDDKIEDSDEISQGVIVDYDRNRNIVGVEFLDFSANKDFQSLIEQYVKDKAA